MKSKKARFEGIRFGRPVARIRVINFRKIRFAPDPRQLKKSRSADLKDPTEESTKGKCVKPLFTILVICITW